MTTELDDFDDFFQPAAAGAGPLDAAAAPAVRSVPPRLGLLAPLNDAEFDQVARAARLTQVDAGTVVIAQGGEGDRFFILVEGTAAVERDGELIATLQPGAFFGESALLVDGRRSASVTMVAPGSLWSISYEAFHAAVSHHLTADEHHGAEVERRLAATPHGRFEAR